jgi:hypothetical protein
MKAWLSQLPKKIAEGLIVRGASALIILGAVGLFFLVRDSGSVRVSPVLLIACGALIALLAVVALAYRRGRRKYLTFHLLHLGYTNVLYQALESIQKSGLHDWRDINLDEVIEKGILHPFRDLLVEIMGGDVRLSILVLEADRWSMALQAGHRLESQRAFDLAYENSFSRFAYESQNIEYSNKLDDDPRFQVHPEARPDRDYKSIVSLPIVVNEQPKAVFNVIATRQEAFDPGDFFYVGLTGAVINVAWALRQAPPDPFRPPD